MYRSTNSIRRMTIGALTALMIASTFVAGSHYVLAQAPREDATSPPQDPRPGTLAYDRNMWHNLLNEHTKIRRIVRHTEKGVEAVTESDDEAIAGKIIDHAKAMQARIKSGARVRMWDPVFAELFAKHDAITIEVTPTEKGVTIVESSADAEVVALLRSHAMGVSEFVRSGFEVAPRETPKFKAGDPLPPPELTIGGVPHRFLLSQPDAQQIAELKSDGVDVIVNFRHAREHADYDERGAAAAAGITYCNLAYGGAVELTDDLLDSARAAIKDADERGDVAALHCRTGNRVGPGWAAYRALDRGIGLEQAISEAEAMQMVDPLTESKTRDYIRRKSQPSEAASGWSLITDESLSEQQQVQKRRAVEARDAMFSRLLAALQEAIEKPAPEGGVAGAIAVCKTQAPKVAQVVAREKGVMIGRTSHMLRNAANIAPTWADHLLRERPVDPRMTVNSDGSFGMTLPIRLMANCLACHGPAEQIDPVVKAALEAQYPNDLATGFKEGDLRGWFWVEVPPAP